MIRRIKEESPCYRCCHAVIDGPDPSVGIFSSCAIGCARGVVTNYENLRKCEEAVDIYD